MAQPAWTYLRLVNRCLRNLRKPTIDDVQDQNNARIAQDVIEIVREEYQELCSRQDWHWLRKSAFINAIGEVSNAGTFNNGSVVVNTPTTWSDVYIGRKISIDGYEETYTIQDSSTSLIMVLDRAYTGTSSGAAATSFTIYQDEYDVASDFTRMLLVNKFFSNGSIELVGIQEYLRRKFENKPYVVLQGSNKPRFATLIDENTLAIWPWPKDTVSIPYEFIRAPAELKSDSDTFAIPQVDMTVLIHRVMMIMFGYIEEDTRANLAAALYTEKYNAMTGSKTSVDDNLQLVIGNRDRVRFRRARRGARTSFDFGEVFDRTP